MASAVKHSRTVTLVLESLEQKHDGNDGMSSGKESYLYRQLQHTSDRSRYKLSCATALLGEHTLYGTISNHSLYSSDRTYSPRIY